MIAATAFIVPVLEIIYAAYASAAQGKKIGLPYYAKVAKPIDLWLQPLAGKE